MKRGLKAGSDILHGKFISIDFFSRHWVAVTVGVLLLVWYISNKYECQTSMEQVKKLENELEIVRGDYVNEHSRYMSSIREGVMEDLARKHHLNLKVQDAPPYKLKYNDSPASVQR